MPFWDVPPNVLKLIFEALADANISYKVLSSVLFSSDNEGYYPYMRIDLGAFSLKGIWQCVHFGRLCHKLDDLGAEYATTFQIKRHLHQNLKYAQCGKLNNLEPKLVTFSRI